MGEGQHIISLFYISTFVDLEIHWIGLRTSLDFDFNRTTTLRNKIAPPMHEPGNEARTKKKHTPRLHKKLIYL